MPKALSDLKRKKLIADYAVNHSYSETARINGVSANGVKKIVTSRTANPEFAQAVRAKNAQNSSDILEYMDSTKDRVCKLIDVYLEAMLDVDKVDKAKLSELSTVFGTVIDKYIKVGIVRTNNVDSQGNEPIVIEFKGGGK
ncbi:MAG: helix-turn-helix domain-containing protein [Clostridia bacterium]